MTQSRVSAPVAVVPPTRGGATTDDVYDDLTESFASDAIQEDVNRMVHVHYQVIDALRGFALRPVLEPGLVPVWFPDQQDDAGCDADEEDDGRAETHRGHLQERLVRALDPSRYQGGHGVHALDLEQGSDDEHVAEEYQDKRNSVHHHEHDVRSDVGFKVSVVQSRFAAVRMQVREVARP